MPSSHDVVTPLRTPVEVLKVSPPGSVPLSENVGGGTPVAVTVKESTLPVTNSMLAGEVIWGATFTVRIVEPQIEAIHAVIVADPVETAYAEP